MKKTIAIALLGATLAYPADWTKRRRLAQIAACAASGLDAATSLRAGVREENTLLGAGQPSAGRMIGLKAVQCAGVIALSEWTHRRGHDHEKAAALESVAVSGMFTAIAIHNYRQK